MCLKDVEIDVPLAVRRGDTVAMRCTYDLEGDELYSIKWYKSRTEFYRYVPKEMPPMKVFAIEGLDVDLNLSGPNDLVLRNIAWDLSGKYKCEVSIDAPYFHTQVVAGHMYVVDPPLEDPVIRLEKKEYDVGEMIRGNCTSPATAPASNITWTVNDKQVEPIYENVSSASVDVDFPQRFVKFSSLHVRVSSFHVGKLKINCTVDLYGVFSTSAVLTLQQERPKLASIMGNFETSSGILLKKDGEQRFLLCLVLAAAALVSQYIVPHTCRI